MGGITIKRGILALFLLLLTGCSSFLNTSEPPQTEFATGGFEASIYGDFLVASDFKFLNIFNLTNKELLKTIDIPMEYGALGFDIFENYVVWADLRNEDGQEEYWDKTNSDIFLYNLKTDETKQITNSSSAQSFPKIWGNYIIWQDNREDQNKEYPGRWKLYLYDINTGQEKIITHSLAAIATYAINNNKIVWEDERNFNGDDVLRGGENVPENNKDIYLYDIDTDEEIAIATGPFMESAPDIFGDIIVYEDRGGGLYEADIVMFNLGTGKRINITDDSHNQATPKVYGANIVWMDERRGTSSNDVYINGKAPNSDIYMYNIESRKETLMTGDEPQILPQISQDRLVFTISRQVEPLVEVVKLRN